MKKNKQNKNSFTFPLWIKKLFGYNEKFKVKVYKHTSWGDINNYCLAYKNVGYNKPWINLEVECMNELNPIVGSYDECVKLAKTLTYKKALAFQKKQNDLIKPAPLTKTWQNY